MSVARVVHHIAATMIRKDSPTVAVQVRARPSSTLLRAGVCDLHGDLMCDLKLFKLVYSRSRGLSPSPSLLYVPRVCPIRVPKSMWTVCA